MGKDIEVKTSAKKVSNSKTEKQNEEKEKLKKEKEEASKKAKEKQKEAKEKAEKKAEEEVSQKEEKGIINEETIEVAKTLAGKALNSKKVKSKSQLIIGILIGLVVGFLLSTLLGAGKLLTGKVNEGKESVDEVIEEHFTGYTALDFENAILGAAIEHQDLIVMEQPLEVETTITKSGLGNLAIFSKVKSITYSGSGIYTVDMSHIDKDHIDVDMDNKVVKVKIPHTVLFKTVLDVDNIKFEDTEKGLLSFGDLKLTNEEVNKVEKAVKDSMEEKLNAKELFKEADEFATLKTWQIFQPLITAVSPEFVVEMVFE